MKKHHEKNQDPSRIEMSKAELDELVEEVRLSSLNEKSKSIVINVLVSFLWLNHQLSAKTLSIKKLMRLFFGSKTEKTKDNPPDKDEKPPKDPPSTSGSGGSTGSQSSENSKKPKGHGKNGQAQYQGADHLPVAHPTLKPGDQCPACQLGRLYDYGHGSVLRLFGQAPIVAKVYEPERLRCALCQETWTAKLPVDAGESRHHPTAEAMVALLTSGAGMPAYRLEGLQTNLGVPLSDSTQSDIRENMANHLQPVLKCLERLAANGRLLHNDDTPNKILELMKENKTLAENARRGIQTTGIVSMSETHRIALFTTGRDHAGENLAKLMKLRDPGAPLAIQMGDAAALNILSEYRDLLIKCLCLDHGRRNFFDLLSEFKKECHYLIEEIAKIYKHDAHAKQLHLSPQERLAYHQEHSAPVMNALNVWMEENLENRDVEPNSNLGKAIGYFLKHWNGLTQFLRIEGAPLSNGEVERLLKKCVLRRKVSMFYKTQVGAWIGDVLMSVIETARMNDVNIFDYLVALRTHNTLVRANPDRWLPWNFQLALHAL